MRFMGKLAERPRCETVVIVGISYDRRTKKHECAGEVVVLAGK